MTNRDIYSYLIYGLTGRHTLRQKFLGVFADKYNVLINETVFYMDEYDYSKHNHNYLNSYKIALKLSQICIKKLSIGLIPLAMDLNFKDFANQFKMINIERQETKRLKKVIKRLSKGGNKVEKTL